MTETERESPGQLIVQNNNHRQEVTGNHEGRQAGTQLAPFMGEGLVQSGMSHEELVEGFRGFIQFWEKRLYQDHHIHFSPLQIIRNKLGLYKDLADDQTRANVIPIAMAWDVLAYEHYEPGSPAESSTCLEMTMYYQKTRESRIKLSEPQVKIVDALTEATGIPHQRGQAEIEIPEKLRHYSQWINSEERLARIAEARSKKSRR